MRGAFLLMGRLLSVGGSIRPVRGRHGWQGLVPPRQYQNRRPSYYLGAARLVCSSVGNPGSKRTPLFRLNQVWVLYEIMPVSDRKRTVPSDFFTSAIESNRNDPMTFPSMLTGQAVGRFSRIRYHHAQSARACKRALNAQNEATF